MIIIDKISDIPTSTRTCEGIKRFSKSSIQTMRELIDAGKTVLIGNDWRNPNCVVQTNSRRHGKSIRTISWR